MVFVRYLQHIKSSAGETLLGSCEILKVLSSENRSYRSSSYSNVCMIGCVVSVGIAESIGVVDAAWDDI